jgi:hypothetical protein
MTKTADIDPLTRLAIQHGTDKWMPHVYTPIYHTHFFHLRDRPVRVLEIGVGGFESPRIGGNSLRMWADYFSRGPIVGFDIREKKIAPHERITVLRGSQDDPAFLRDVIAAHGPFDIVIDDGSHDPKHMVASFKILFPAVVDGGFYTIEDLQFAFAKMFGGSPAGAEPMQLADDIMRGMNSAGLAFGAPIRALHSYRNLLIIERGDTAEPATLPYDLDAPNVARAIAAVESELARAPTADGLAHLARNYARGRNHAKLVATVRHGLAQWPDHLHLLVLGAQFAGRAGDTALREQCITRLETLAPDDPLVRKVCRRRPAD